MATDAEEKQRVTRWEDRQKREGCGPKSRNPRVDGHHQRLKEVKKPLLWGCPREHGPVSALISDFSLLELSEKKFLLF